MAALRTAAFAAYFGEGSMKKRIIAALVGSFALIATLIVLPTAGAAFTPPTGTGVRLGGIFRDGAERAILANTAFYVTQSFVVDDPNAGYCGGAGQPVCDTAVDVQQSSISLTMDGKRQNGLIYYTYTDTKPRQVVAKAYLFNFPNGLPVGTHVMSITFTIRGANAGTFTQTLDALASCENGTIDGLQCAPPPA
jgi:hypothetical protein